MLKMSSSLFPLGLLNFFLLFGLLLNQALSLNPFTHSLKALPGSPHSIFMFLLKVSLSFCILLWPKSPSRLPIISYPLLLSLRLYLFNKDPLHCFIPGSFSFPFWFLTSHWLFSGLPCVCWHLTLGCLMCTDINNQAVSAVFHCWHQQLILDFRPLPSVNFDLIFGDNSPASWWFRKVLLKLRTSNSSSWLWK